MGNILFISMFHKINVHTKTFILFCFHKRVSLIWTDDQVHYILIE